MPRRHPTTLTLIAALALVAMSAPPMASVAAQTAAAPQSPPSQSPPAAAAPAPKSAPGGTPAMQSALKLAGLVTFVANACPKLQPNYPRFMDAINALGLTKGDLEKTDMKAGYLGYAARYNTDVEASCERAEALFGPKGTTIAGIFDPR